MKKHNYDDISEVKKFEESYKRNNEDPTITL